MPISQMRKLSCKMFRNLLEVIELVSGKAEMQTRLSGLLHSALKLLSTQAGLLEAGRKGPGEAKEGFVESDLGFEVKTRPLKSGGRK